jgi:hypothetical protein
MSESEKRRVEMLARIDRNAGLAMHGLMAEFDLITTVLDNATNIGRAAYVVAAAMEKAREEMLPPLIEH